jgi:hypothetical protein
MLAGLPVVFWPETGSMHCHNGGLEGFFVLSSERHVNVFLLQNKERLGAQ